MPRLAAFVLIFFSITHAHAELPAKVRRSKKRKKPVYHLSVHAGNVATNGDTLEKWRSDMATSFLRTAVKKRRLATIDKKSARARRLKSYRADFSITGFALHSDARAHVVNCTYQMAVSDARGRILTTLSGSANVSLDREEAMPHTMPATWNLALNSAAKAAEKDLSNFLVSHARKRR